VNNCKQFRTIKNNIIQALISFICFRRFWQNF